MPPVRPLPSVRGSGALVSRDTTMPNGMEPTTYDSAASTMATTICSAVTPGRTSWTPDDAGGLWPESSTAPDASNGPGASLPAARRTIDLDVPCPHDRARPGRLPERRPPRDPSGDPLTDGRRLLQRLRSRRPRRGHRRLRGGLPRLRSSASRSPSSTRTSSAARASIAAASRPRRCSRARRSTSASATPRTSGSTSPARRSIDYAQMAKRRDQVVTRMWKGVQTPRQEVRRDLDPGPRQARRRAQGPGPDGGRGRHARAPGGERVLNATDVILATGSRVKSLPGHRARRQADRHLGRRPEDGHAARERHRHRRGRGRRRVRLDVPRPRRRR